MTTESSLQSTPPTLTDSFKMLVNEVEDCLCKGKLFDELETTNKNETVNLTRITTKTTMILPIEILASLLHLCAAENTC